MTKCSGCSKTFLPTYKCPHCDKDESPKAGASVEPCKETCKATIYVQETLTGKPVAKAAVTLDGKKLTANEFGLVTKDKLDPGPHAAAVTLEGFEDKYAFPIGKDGSAETKTIAVDENKFYTFTLDPLATLKVIVKRRHDDKGVLGTTVKIKGGKAGNTPAKVQGVTPVGGDQSFEKLRQDTYHVEVELDDDNKKKLELEKIEEHHPLDMATATNELILWARLVIHLKLKYKDPDDTERVFPKDFPVKVAFNDGGTLDLKVLDDKGYIKFEVADAAKTNFTLKFDSPKVRYLVHEKDKPIADLKEDLDGPALRTLTDDGKQFFALPKAWVLTQSPWTLNASAIPVDGKILIPAEGIGTTDAPQDLLLTPKFQYLRFEFHDRKYGKSKHADARVGIPAVVLKGARDSTAAGAPQNPLAGTHDTISNWMVDKADNAAACQVLPWIVTKTDAGVDLPKFNRQLLLEFGQDDAFVHSTGDKAAERKIIVLPVGDDKRKPSRDRNLYYDLPKVWKSACYYTRFSDANKNCFFDELLLADDPELEASYGKGAKLTFSLDDIVLVTNADSPLVKDRTELDAAVDIDAHSRLTMLWFDPADKHKVKVYKPRATAAYWSETEFAKEKVGLLRRNAIVDYPVNPRVVVFADGFYDIYDKRTEAADFTLKQALGARAAKLHDAHISSGPQSFNNAGAVNSYYVHKVRLFHLHYLHFGATDGSTVFGAMVTFWNCRFRVATGNDAKGKAYGGVPAFIPVYREEGMERAMKRWNEKDYYFEEADDKRDVVVKHFCLFEAKDVQTAPNVYPNKRGGKEMCLVSVRDDKGGSSASGDGLTMMMRASGARDEGDNWGHPAKPLTPVVQYDMPNASPASAFAHELGHGAIGLWDDYVTGKTVVPGADVTLWSYTSQAGSDLHGQRYPGMPYEVDASPLMASNRAVRLRYYWGRGKWLNDLSGAALNLFLAGKQFRAAYEPASGAAKLKYVKPAGATFQSIYRPTVSGANAVLGTNGRCDWHLYHLGEDEFAKSKDGGPYTGVLALCVRLFARFQVPAWALSTDYAVDDLVTRDGNHYKCLQAHKSISSIGKVFGSSAMSATKWATVNAAAVKQQAVAHVEDLNQRMLTMLQDKFKLQGNGNFSTTYLRIFPQWEIDPPGGGVIKAGEHFTINFTFGSAALTPAGQVIAAGVRCDPKALIRYIFGRTGATDFTKDELPELKVLMDTNAGGRFNVGLI